MEEKRTSVFENGLIWFGAAVSIAEILTGTYFAPLGMARGFAAIVAGHVIGCALFFLAGLIGGRTGRSAMESLLIQPRSVMPTSTQRMISPPMTRHQTQ